MIVKQDAGGGEIEFDNKRITHSEGRNGNYLCTGVDVYFMRPDIITLTGYTSKHQTVRGHLSIPKQDIPDLIQLLKDTIQ